VEAFEIVMAAMVIDIAYEDHKVTLHRELSDDRRGKR